MILPFLPGTLWPQTVYLDEFVIYFAKIVRHTEYFRNFVLGDHHSDCFCCFDFVCLLKYTKTFAILLIINILYFIKIHRTHVNIVDSVIILDELQTLPTDFLQPIVDAMKAYHKLFGVSFLFTTASQPVLSGTIKGTNPKAEIDGIEHVSEIILIDSPKSCQTNIALHIVNVLFTKKHCCGVSKFPFSGELHFSKYTLLAFICCCLWETPTVYTCADSSPECVFVKI